MMTSCLELVVCVLLAIPVAFGAAALTFYGMQGARHRADDSLHPDPDAVRRLRGLFRRKPSHDRTEKLLIASIRDPAAAAVAMLVVLASSRGALTPAAESAIRDEMRQVMALPNPDETYTFARRIAEQENDPEDIVRRFSKIWMKALQPSERADLYDMASRVAAADGEPTDDQAACLKVLRKRLGLTRP